MNNYVLINLFIHFMHPLEFKSFENASQKYPHYFRNQNRGLTAKVFNTTMQHAFDLEFIIPFNVYIALLLKGSLLCTTLCFKDLRKP